FSYPGPLESHDFFNNVAYRAGPTRARRDISSYFLYIFYSIYRAHVKTGQFHHTQIGDIAAHAQDLFRDKALSGHPVTQNRTFVTRIEKHVIYSGFFHKASYTHLLSFADNRYRIIACCSDPQSVVIAAMDAAMPRASVVTDPQPTVRAD